MAPSDLCRRCCNDSRGCLTNLHAPYLDFSCIFSLCRASLCRYVVTTNTLEQDIGIENLNQVIERIRARIVASEGRLEVKMEPKVVSQRDEADLQAMIKRIEEENEEVDGDAPEDA